MLISVISLLILSLSIDYSNDAVKRMTDDLGRHKLTGIIDFYKIKEKALIIINDMIL